MARRGGHSRSGYENVVFLGRENNAATHAQRTFCRLATVKLKDTRVTVKGLRLGLRGCLWRGRVPERRQSRRVATIAATVLKLESRDPRQRVLGL
jgi:hypothetical protein